MKTPAAAAQLLLLGLIGLSVAWVDYLPTHDGPQHIFAVHAANHLDQPGTGWGHWLQPNLPVTSQGFTAIFGPLDALLPWRTATRVALTLMALGWALGAFCLLRAVRPERSWLGVALGAAALQWSFYMGLFSFYIASAAGLFILAYAFGRELRRPREVVLLALLLLVQAVMHVFAALLTGLTLAALLWLRSAGGERLRALVGIALLAAPAASVAVATVLLRSADADVASSGIDYAPPPWWTLGKCFLGGPAWRAWPLSLLAVAAPLLVLLTRHAGVRAEDRALLLAGGGFLLAGALAPLDLESWEFFSVRFLPMAVCLLVAAVPLERLPGRRAAAVALCVFALAATGWAASYNRDLALSSRDALAGLDADIARDGWRLPMVLDPYAGRAFDDAEAEMPFAVPLFNLGKLYATEQGGMPTHAFVSERALHVLALADGRRAEIPDVADPRLALDLADPEAPEDPAHRRAVASYLAARATGYQDVILWGRPDDVDYLRALGFAVEWQRGRLAILRFEGCPLAVRFPPGSELPDDAVLEVGWFPAWGVTHRYEAARAHRQRDGSLALPVRQSCGSVWVRLQGGDRVCDGADSEGRLLIPWTRETPEVDCHLRRVDG